MRYQFKVFLVAVSFSFCLGLIAPNSFAADFSVAKLSNNNYQISGLHIGEDKRGV